MSKAARASNFEGASSAEKAPFASTRKTISSFENRCRMVFQRASSWSKSIAPTFILMQLNPAANFCSN